MLSKHLCMYDVMHIQMHNNACRGLNFINKDTCSIFLQLLPGLVYMHKIRESLTVRLEFIRCIIVLQLVSKFPQREVGQTCLVVGSK